MKTLTVTVEGLQPGDEFWADKPFAHGDDWGYETDPDVGDYMAYKIVNDPLDSHNMPLFEDVSQSASCVVVAVEYPDGARGSRLFKPGQTITIRREERPQTYGA